MMSRRVVVLLVVSLFVDSAQSQNESSQLEKRSVCVAFGDYCNNNCCRGMVCLANYNDYRCAKLPRCKNARSHCNSTCCGENYCSLAYRGSRCIVPIHCSSLGEACDDDCCPDLFCSKAKSCEQESPKCMNKGERCDDKKRICCKGLECSFYSVDRTCVPAKPCRGLGEYCKNDCCEQFQCLWIPRMYLCYDKYRFGVRPIPFTAGTRRNMAPCRLLAALVVFVWILH